MYHIQVAASYKSPRTGRICKSVQDWVAYVTKPDGKVESFAGWATKKQAMSIANDYVFKQQQRATEEV